MGNLIWIILGGAFGGLIKAIFDGEHKLAKPLFVGEYFYLGFLGNIIIGIGVAIVGMSYLFNAIDGANLLDMQPLELLATSIAFGIAANSVIEGIVEKVNGRKTNKTIVK